MTLNPATPASPATPKKRESHLIGLRRTLHHGYAIAAIVLMASGLLLTLPDLRAALIGGYGRRVLDVHLWAGVAFLALPGVALALEARGLIGDLLRRLGPPDGLTWRKIHTVFTLFAGLALGLTGVIAWWDPPQLSRTVADAMLDIHSWLSWAIIGALVLHSAVAWRPTVARTRELLGRGRMDDDDPELRLFDFADDD